MSQNTYGHAGMWSLNNNEGVVFLDTQPDCLNYQTLGVNPLKNNKKTMNFIEKARMEEFAKSSKVKVLVANVKNAEELEMTYNLVSNKLSNLVRAIGADRDMLNDAVDREDYNEIERLSDELEAKLDELEASKLDANIQVIAKQFGVELKAGKKASKKDVRKSLGLVEKETKSKVK